MEHDAICEVCGALIPCEEAECVAPAGHPGICETCLAGERRAARRYADELPDADFYGY